jgi:hypothetical protein
MYPPRASARAAASAASSPRTNPLRSNNDRDDSTPRRTSSYDPSMSSHRAVGDSGSDLSSSQSIEDGSADQQNRNAQLLNQIIQVRYTSFPQAIATF